MNRCAWCRKPFRFWQKRVEDMGGYEHVACWRARWASFMGKDTFRHLTSTLQWRGVLIMPREYVADALAIIDASVLPVSDPYAVELAQRTEK